MKKTIAAIALIFMISACDDESLSKEPSANEPLDGYWIDDEGTVLHFTESNLEIFSDDNDYNCYSSTIYFDLTEYDSNSFVASADVGLGIQSQKFVYSYLDESVTLTQLSGNTYSNFSDLNRISNLPDDLCYSTSRSGDITVNIEFESLPSNILSDFSWGPEDTLELTYYLELSIDSYTSIDFVYYIKVEQSALAITYSWLAHDAYIYHTFISDTLSPTQQGNQLVFTFPKALHPILSEVSSSTSISFEAVFSSEQFTSIESISPQVGLNIQDDTGTVIGDSLDLLDVVSIEVSID